MEKLKAITIADNEAFLRQKSAPVDLKDNKLSNNISVLDIDVREDELRLFSGLLKFIISSYKFGESLKHTP